MTLTIICLLALLLINDLVARCVLAAIDRNDLLLSWFRSAPGGVFCKAAIHFVALQAWPVVVFRFCK